MVPVYAAYKLCSLPGSLREVRARVRVPVCAHACPTEPGKVGRERPGAGAGVGGGGGPGAPPSDTGSSTTKEGTGDRSLYFRARDSWKQRRVQACLEGTAHKAAPQPLRACVPRRFLGTAGREPCCCTLASPGALLGTQRLPQGLKRAVGPQDPGTARASWGGRDGGSPGSSEPPRTHPSPLRAKQGPLSLEEAGPAPQATLHQHQSVSVAGTGGLWGPGGSRPGDSQGSARPSLPLGARSERTVDETSPLTRPPLFPGPDCTAPHGGGSRGRCASASRAPCPSPPLSSRSWPTPSRPSRSTSWWTAGRCASSG